MAIEFKVIPSPTNKNWKIVRDGEEVPLVFADSKEDAVKQARVMAEEHGGKVVVLKKPTEKSTKAAKRATPKRGKKAA